MEWHLVHFIVLQGWLPSPCVSVDTITPFLFHCRSRRDIYQLSLLHSSLTSLCRPLSDGIPGGFALASFYEAYAWLNGKRILSACPRRHLCSRRFLRSIIIVGQRELLRILAIYGCSPSFYCLLCRPSTRRHCSGIEIIVRPECSKCFLVTAAIWAVWLLN